MTTRRTASTGPLFLLITGAVGAAENAPTSQKTTGSLYEDGRPAATRRLEAEDQGVVLRHGDGPEQCDIYGARDVWAWEANGKFYMHYDAAGPQGWLAALATSDVLIRWIKKGPVLNLGKTGEDDSASASYGVTFCDQRLWHMFYMGTPNATPPPERIPAFPYLTCMAAASSPTGPWTKQPRITPFRPKPGTYYSATASPGQVVRQGEIYLQFFSASVLDKGVTRRTIGIARTRDLNGPWTIGPQPILPLAEQIENTSIYHEPASKLYFLFTNHIGIEKGIEFTDAIWVYWSPQLDRWSPADKAVVLDGRNCKWSSKCIGLPSVIPVKGRLAILYDAPGGDSISHVNRDVGLAWLDLPLAPPRQ